MGSGAKKRKCGRRKGDGSRCKLPAGYGTPHLGSGQCKWHGGNSPAHLRKAAMDAATSEAANLPAWARSIDVTPADAMLAMVQRQAGWVSFVSSRVAELTAESLVANDEVSAWIRLEQDGGDKLMRWCKMVRDAGVDEWRVQQARRVGELLAMALEDGLSQIPELDEQMRRRIVGATGAALRRMEMQPAIEGSATEAA